MKQSIQSFSEAIKDIGTGSAESAASHYLAQCVQSLVNHPTDKKSKLTIEITIARTKGTGQLLVRHRVTGDLPTNVGGVKEYETGDTLMYASATGILSVLPFNQESFDIEENQ